MLIKTDINSYLDKDLSSFDFKNEHFFVEELTQNLKSVYVRKGSQFFGTAFNLGIYNKRKGGFVLCGNDKSLLLQHALNTNSDLTQETIFDLKNKIEKYIKKELSDLSKFENTRPILNDLSNHDYLTLVNNYAENFYLNGILPTDNKISFNHFDITFTDKLLIDAIEDIYDMAYTFAENFLENNPNCLYDHFLYLDIMKQLNILSANTDGNLAAMHYIQKNLNDSKHKTVSVIEDGTIEYHKELKIKKEDIKLIPIESIESINWRNNEIYNKNLFKKIKNNTNWFIYKKIGNYNLDNFIPTYLINDESFWKKKLNENDCFINLIPQKFLNDKSIVLKFMNATNYKKSKIFKRLSNSLQLDSDILDIVCDNVNSFIEIPNEIASLEQVQLYFLNKQTNFKSLNIAVKLNKLDFNNQKIYNTLKDNILNKKIVFSEIYCTNLIKIIKEKDVIIYLIKNYGLSFYSFHLFDEKILNDVLFWNEIKNINLDGLINIEIFPRLNNNIKYNDEIMSNILLNSNSNGNIRKIIINSIGIDNFSRRKNLQKLCLKHNHNYLQFVSNEIANEFIYEKMKNNESISFYDVLHSPNIDIKEVINNIISINPNYMKQLTKSYIYIPSIINNSFWINIINKNPSIIDYFDDMFIRSNNEIALEISKYKSIIKIVMNKKLIYNYNLDLSKNKEFVLNCLHHNFLDFREIEKPCKRNNYYSLLENKEFLIEAFNISSSINDKRIAIDYLQQIKNKTIKDNEILKTILSHNFELLDCFNRTIYNDKNLISDIIKNSNQTKCIFKNTLTKVNSKLLKDKDIISLIS